MILDSVSRQGESNGTLAVLPQRSNMISEFKGGSKCSVIVRTNPKLSTACSSLKKRGDGIVRAESCRSVELRMSVSHLMAPFSYADVLSSCHVCSTSVVPH
jgi:hypothetical protein